MTTLVNTSNKGPSSKKKGRSKKAHVLAVSVEQATQNFLEKGEQIAKDSQDLKEELIAAVEDVRKQGEDADASLFFGRNASPVFCIAVLVINWSKTSVPVCNIPCVYHQTPIIPTCPQRYCFRYFEITPRSYSVVERLSGLFLRLSSLSSVFQSQQLQFNASAALATRKAWCHFSCSHWICCLLHFHQ